MRKRFLLETAVGAVVLLTASAQATTIIFSGPEDTDGNPCTPGAERCVLGTDYTIFGASLTQPTTTNPDWVLTIQTEYPATIKNGATSIPTAAWTGDGQQYSIPDFLIAWNGNDYGIVLSPHVKAGVAVDTSYQAGNLYEVKGTNGFQLSENVIPVNTAPRPLQPVWLDPGGMAVGSGPGSVLVNTSGNDSAGFPLYQITVDFSAPNGFLSTGNFSIQMSSFVCANGMLIGNGNTGSTTQSTPEPGTFLLIAPLLLLAGYRLARR